MKHVILLLTFGAALAASAATEQPIADRIGADFIAVSRSSDFRHFEHGLGVQLTYELSKRFALQLEGDGSDIHKTLLESGSAELRFSIPLGAVSPYAIGGGGFKAPSGELFAVGGVGIEARYKGFRAFADAQVEKSRTTDATALFRLGVGYRF